MNLRTTLLTIAFFTIYLTAYSQPQGRGFSGTIKGTVFDYAFDTPIVYASVIASNQSDSAQVSGTITADDGSFILTGLKPGIYYLVTNFIGYYPKTVSDVMLGRGSPQVDLGKITLQQSFLPMEEVEVSIEKAPVEYHIDKKVINVGKDLTATSGTAIEILEKVPSVTVDIEGNVKLRGSENFTVLIDGRPSILESSEALQQIPASAIEQIEIITNPSAKYDPDGTSGIINVIMKKSDTKSTSGTVNLDLGYNDKYGAEIRYNYRRKKVGLTLALDYKKMHYPGSIERENRTTISGENSYLYSQGDMYRDRIGYGIQGEIDYNLTVKDIITLGLRYGGRGGNSHSESNYNEWSEPDLIHQYYTNLGESERSGNFYAANLKSVHKFDHNGSEISAMVDYSFRAMTDESIDKLTDSTGFITEGNKSTEEGPGIRLIPQIDYTLSLNETDKFEAGWKSRLSDSEEQTKQYDYDTLSGDFLFQPDFSHNVEYKDYIHSLYALYSGEYKNFGYQGGLRGEYTDHLVKLTETGQEYIIDRWDYFPTLHFSFKFNPVRQLMASYTRRINRPRGYYYEPFETWIDAYNVRIGNPDILPEYIDSYELGYQTSIFKNPFSLEAYFRQTDNVIERINSVYSGNENVILHTVDNVGISQALGVEMMLDLSINRWWNLNLMGDIYDYKLEGEVQGGAYTTDSFDWNLRLNSTMKLTKSTKLQVNYRYESPSVTSQGKRSEFYVVDLAVRQEIIPNRIAATLQIRDILNSMKFERTEEGYDFYSHTKFEHESPIFMLNLNFNFDNNHKKERKPGEVIEDVDEGDEY